MLHFLLRLLYRAFVEMYLLWFYKEAQGIAAEILCEAKIGAESAVALVRCALKNYILSGAAGPGPNIPRQTGKLGRRTTLALAMDSQGKNKTSFIHMARSFFST